MAPFISTYNDVLPPSVKVVVDHHDTIRFCFKRCLANLSENGRRSRCGFHQATRVCTKGCPSLQAGVRACEPLCGLIGLPFHCKFSHLTVGGFKSFGQFVILVSLSCCHEFCHARATLAPRFPSNERSGKQKSRSVLARSPGENGCQGYIAKVPRAARTLVFMDGSFPSRLQVTGTTKLNKRCVICVCVASRKPHGWQPPGRSKRQCLRPVWTRCRAGGCCAGTELQSVGEQRLA